MGRENEIQDVAHELLDLDVLTYRERAEILYEALQIRPLNPFISPAQLVRWAAYDYYKRAGTLPVPDSKDRADSAQH
jgi:hypothetical protein